MIMGPQKSTFPNNPLDLNGVQHGLVVKCHNLGVLCSSHSRFSGFFSGSVLGQDTSEPQPSTGKNREKHKLLP